MEDLLITFTVRTVVGKYQDFYLRKIRRIASYEYSFDGVQYRPLEMVLALPFTEIISVNAHHKRRLVKSWNINGNDLVAREMRRKDINMVSMVKNIADIIFFTIKLSEDELEALAEVDFKRAFFTDWEESFVIEFIVDNWGSIQLRKKGPRYEVRDGVTWNSWIPFGTYLWPTAPNSVLEKMYLIQVVGEDENDLAEWDRESEDLIGEKIRAPGSIEHKVHEIANEIYYNWIRKNIQL